MTFCDKYWKYIKRKKKKKQNKKIDIVICGCFCVHIKIISIADLLHLYKKENEYNVSFDELRLSLFWRNEKIMIENTISIYQLKNRVLPRDIYRLIQIMKKKKAR